VTVFDVSAHASCRFPAIRLQSGRKAKIHYDGDKPPWIASYLQDFSGCEIRRALGPTVPRW
jgi:hypothetical protein